MQLCSGLQALNPRQYLITSLPNSLPELLFFK